MSTKLNFKQKRDIVLKSVVDLNQRLNQTLVIQEKYLSFGEDDNAWLLVLSNYDESKLYFSVFEWEIKGDFIKRVSQKKNPFSTSITEVPSNVVEAIIYDEGVVVFKLSNREYILFNFAGKMVLRTFLYPEVQSHLDFMKEVSMMQEYGVCWVFLGKVF